MMQTEKPGEASCSAMMILGDKGHRLLPRASSVPPLIESWRAVKKRVGGGGGGGERGEGRVVLILIQL